MLMRTNNNIVPLAHPSFAWRIGSHTANCLLYLFLETMSLDVTGVKIFKKVCFASILMWSPLPLPSSLSTGTTFVTFKCGHKTDLYCSLWPPPFSYRFPCPTPPRYFLFATPLSFIIHFFCSSAWSSLPGLKMLFKTAFVFGMFIAPVYSSVM